MADLNLGMKCIKYMIFVTNAVFTIIAIWLIIAGSVIYGAFSDYETFVESSDFTPAALLIAIGVIILVVSAFGCFGAIRQSTLLINLYAVCLCLILILEIAAAVTAFVIRCDIFTKIDENMSDTLDIYSTNSSAKKSWDFVQKNLHCCGVHHPTDWRFKNVDGPAVTIDGNTFTVPLSCCTDPVKCKGKEIYTDGCLEALTDTISHSALWIGYGGIGVAVVQLLGIIFSSKLARAIRRAKTEEEIEHQQSRQHFYERVAHGGPQDDPMPRLYSSQSSDA